MRTCGAPAKWMPKTGTIDHEPGYEANIHRRVAKRQQTTIIHGETELARQRMEHGVTRQTLAELVGDRPDIEHGSRIEPGQWARNHVVHGLTGCAAIQ